MALAALSFYRAKAWRRGLKTSPCVLVPSWAWGEQERLRLCTKGATVGFIHPFGLQSYLLRFGMTGPPKPTPNTLEGTWSPRDNKPSLLSIQPFGLRQEISDCGGSKIETYLVGLLSWQGDAQKADGLPQALERLEDLS